MDNNTIVLFRRSKHPNMSINSRSGSMLVLVLIIMAVSIILITSALMISTAGRQRYYKDAEREQASLTAMSAAKLICQAVVKNDISAKYKDPATTCTLEELAASGAVVNLSSSGIPGLAGTPVSNPESNSVAVFGYYPNPNSVIPYISVTVTTTLDAGITGTASTEEVVLLLEKKVTISKDKANLLTLGLKGATNELNKVSIGQMASLTDEDGFVVVHGNVLIGDSLINYAAGSPTIYSNIIFTGNVTLGAGTDFYSSLIFYGDDASLVQDATGHGLNTLNGNVFFLRETRASIFTTAAGIRADSAGGTRVDVDNGGIYLLNSDMNTTTVSTNIGIVVGENSSALPQIAPIPSADTITLLTDTAVALAISTAESVNRTVYTAEAAALITAYFPNLYTDCGDVKGAASILPLDNLDVTTLNMEKPAGSYYIDVSDPNVNKIMNNLTFNLAAGDVNLYIIDTSPGAGHALDISIGSIHFINSTPNVGTDGRSSVGRILLLDGADIDISPNNQPATKGIFASSGGAPFLFINGLPQMSGGVENDTANNPNVITVDAHLDGYVGLYGKNGMLEIDNNAVLYIRYEGAELLRIKQGGGSTNTSLPYCPPPAEDQGAGQRTTSYELAGYIVK